MVLVFTLPNIEMSAFCTAAEFVCCKETTFVVCGESASDWSNSFTSALTSLNNVSGARTTRILFRESTASDIF